MPHVLDVALWIRYSGYRLAAVAGASDGWFLRIAFAVSVPYNGSS
jgi:hypothetical protein